MKFCENEGLVPYCESCGEYRFPPFKTAVSMTVVNRKQDGVLIAPAPPKDAVLSSFGDHRVAMAFSLIGLKTGGVAIEDPLCCAKTFPDYFSILDRITAEGH